MRIEPEYAFDSARDELFVVRVTGNRVSKNGLASNVLMIVGGIYRLDTGRVELLDQAAKVKPPSSSVDIQEPGVYQMGEEKARS